MVTYVIQAIITETDKATLLASMDWLSTTFGTKVTNATGERINWTISITISNTTYADMKTSLNDLETQFSGGNLTWTFGTTG